MRKKQESLRMAKLYRSGKYPRQIAALCSVSVSAVSQRLRAMGFAKPYLTLKAAEFDSSRLIDCYQVQKLPLTGIAAIFGITERTVKKKIAALGLPSRPPLVGGIAKYQGKLRELKIGETADIECRAKYASSVLRGSARRIGITIATRKLAGGITRVTRIADCEHRRIFKLSSIDRERLSDLYCRQELPLVRIARQLNSSPAEITRALRFYEIPPRPPLYGSGKYTGVFKRLGVGETVEIESAAKYAVTNLHSIAVRIGAKISVRKIGDGSYRVTKIK